MKTQFRLWPLILLFAVFRVSSLAGQEASYKIDLSSNSILWIEGDSTFHAFESKAQVVQLDSDVAFEGGITNLTGADFLKNSNRAPQVLKLVLTVPIEKMKSKTMGLDPHLHKALKYKEYPDIVFEMKSYDIKKSAEDADKYVVTANGSLSLAGKTNSIAVVMSASLAGENLNVTGEHNLLMSDFGVPPPTLFFGAIKVADKIVIKWNLNISLVSTSNPRRE